MILPVVHPATDPHGAVYRTDTLALWTRRLRWAAALLGAGAVVQIVARVW